MYPPIVCFSCNNALGDKYYDYREILLKRQKKFIAPGSNEPVIKGMYYSIPLQTEGIQMDDVLDAFHLTKPCCRQHMTTNVRLDDFIEGGGSTRPRD